MNLRSIILSKIAVVQKGKQHPLFLLGNTLHIMFINMFRTGANMDVGYDPRKQTKKVGRWC